MWALKMLVPQVTIFVLHYFSHPHNFVVGQLALPVGLSADSEGNVLVTDSGTGRKIF